MLSKKRGLVIATALALFSFFSVAYLSCTKTADNDPTSCQGKGALCKNGSHCYKGVCVCPVGFEGTYCETETAAKFAGSWDAHQKTTGSDSVYARGRDSVYVIYLKKSATGTTFLIDNFYNNPSYNNLICTIDSVHNDSFVVDTITPFHMLYNSVRIMPGARGGISNHDSVITMSMIVKHLTANINWQRDTLLLELKRRSF